MAECLNCGKNGWFLKVDNNSLCNECQITDLPIIVRNCEVLFESIQIANKSKNVGTVVSRYQLAIQMCDELMPYFLRGVPTVDQPVDDVRYALEGDLAEALEAEIRLQVYNAREKAKDGATSAGKLGGYERAIKSLAKLFDDLEDVTQIEAAISGLREERDGLRFDLLVQKADVYLAKGKKKQALDTFIEAMMALKHDSTPDKYQRGKVELAHARIVELGGTPPEMPENAYFKMNPDGTVDFLDGIE